MAERTPTPKLVIGYIEVVTPDGESRIPYDEAVIHFEGDEDSEIEIRCPDALRLAPEIVAAVNNHDALVKALEKALAYCDNAIHPTDQYADERESLWRPLRASQLEGR